MFEDQYLIVIRGINVTTELISELEGVIGIHDIVTNKIYTKNGILIFMTIPRLNKEHKRIYDNTGHCPMRVLRNDTKNFIEDILEKEVEIFSVEITNVSGTE